MRCRVLELKNNVGVLYTVQFSLADGRRGEEWDTIGSFPTSEEAMAIMNSLTAAPIEVSILEVKADGGL